MMRNRKLATWVLLPVLWCLVRPPTVLAVKGLRRSEADNYPEAVLITAVSFGLHQTSLGCGVLIAPRVVLTAGHCVRGFDSWEVTAPYAQGQRRTTRTASLHPRYPQDRLENDLAVLILDKGIDIGRPFPSLHGGDLYPIEQTKLLVVGRVENGMPSPTRLFQTEVTLVQFPGDLNLYGGFPGVSEKGDSGGPVFLVGKEREVVAVVSGGVGFRAGSGGNVPTDRYMPISWKNRNWILQQIPKIPSTPGPESSSPESQSNPH
ncbi:MAG: trypsin-like serine protease [Planctomycetes bacterium]|nr:trypsin-like serine protease [Planctomycetota bacterium]